jgi:PAS domain S-box-containing protein
LSFRFSAFFEGRACHSLNNSSEAGIVGRALAQKTRDILHFAAPGGGSPGWKEAALRAAACLAAGGFWILFWDGVVLPSARDAEGLARLQAVKGWIFVAAVSLLVYALARRQARQAARHEKSLARFREFQLALFEEFPAPVWTADPGGKVRFVNGKWSAFTGRTAEEEAGSGWTSGVHPEDLPGVLEGCRDAVRRRKPLTLEFRLKSRDGEYRRIAFGGRPVRGPDGEFAGYLGTFDDVTDRRRHEEEARRAGAHEAVGILAEGIARDFDGLMRTVLGNVSLANEGLDPGGEASRRLGEAEEAARKARDLAGRLMTFSAGEAPPRRRMRLDGLIRSSVRAAAEESDARLVFEIGPALRHVWVDEPQLGQALRHVVSNAVQAMPRGGALRVRATNERVAPGGRLSLPQGEYVRIDISDRGAGIPREDLLRVFDPFFTTKGKGSGLGLPTAYSIVRRHDGIMTLDSEPGSGTTVSIYLPASLDKAQWKGLGREREDLSVGKGRILVMDDEEMVRNVASTMLEALGYEVVTARDGEEAVEAYAKAREAGAPFDLLIMDLTVPGGMGGREAILKVRDIDPGVRALVSSGYSSDPVMSDYKAYGFCGMIAKPYSFAEMKRAVLSALDEAA